VAQATTIDQSPRPTILFGKSGRFIVQDAWNSVALYRAADGKRLRKFGAKQRINVFDVTADEGALLVGYRDGSLGLWDINTGKNLRWQDPAQTGLKYVSDACFAHDGRSFVVCDHQDIALICETRTGRQIARVGFSPGEKNIMSAALSPDGSRGALVDLGGHLFLFDVRTRVMKDTGLTGAWPVRYSRDGKHIACRSINSGVREQLRVLKLDEPPVLKDAGQFSYIGHIQATEDGCFLATVEGPDWLPRVGVRYDPGRSRLEELWKSSDHERVQSLTDFDPSTLVGVSTDFRLVTHVTDLRTGTPKLKIDNHANYREELLSWNSNDENPQGDAPWLLVWFLVGGGSFFGLVMVLFHLLKAA